MYCSFDTFEDWLKFWEEELNKRVNQYPLFLPRGVADEMDRVISECIEEDKKAGRFPPTYNLFGMDKITPILLNKSQVDSIKEANGKLPNNCIERDDDLFNTFFKIKEV